MANYIFKESPAYQTQIRALANTDPANAETVLNPVVETLINNTHAVKISSDQHKNDSTKHITSEERSKLADISEKANNYIHPASGITTGTYRSVSVNAQGHITAGSNPTTIASYGLTDAYTKTETDNKLNTKVDNSTFSTHSNNTTSHVSSADRSNWNDANNKKHEHNNKSTLDGVTNAKISNWDNASTSSHTHSNKSILDGVTSGKISNWDSASTNSHTHSNKSILDTITQTMINGWNAITAHITDAVSHITSSERTKWNEYESLISSLNRAMQGTTEIKDANGYMHMPSGLLIQWGRVAANHEKTGPGNILIDIKYTKTFDETPILITNHATSTPSGAGSGVNSAGTSTAQLSSYRATATNARLLWVAIGYKKYTFL